MKDMKFTVITPVLNGDKYLADAIKSVINQSCPHWQYFIIDGGSTDKTLEIANRYAEVDNRITVVSGKDRGMYDAICKGIELSGGEWIHWLNADDVLLPWCISEVVKYANAFDCDWIYAVPSWFDESGNMIGLGRIEYCPRWLIEKGAYYGGVGVLQQESIFFSRKLFERLSQEEIEVFRSFQLAGDYWLWRRFAKRSELAVLPVVVGGFRLTGENLSHVNQSEYLREVHSTRPLGRWVKVLKPFLFLASVYYAYYVRKKWSDIRIG